MSSHFWWYVARAGGLVAWALVLASCTWGLLHALRAFGRRPSPAWMLSTHRYLSALAIAFVAVHVVAILADDFVHFSLADVLVPMVSSWHPLAVAWGIVGMYVLLAVEVTSLCPPAAVAQGLAGHPHAQLRAAGPRHRPLPHRRHRRQRPPPHHVAVLIGVATVFGAAMLLTWRTAPKVRTPGGHGAVGAGYRPVTWAGGQPVGARIRATLRSPPSRQRGSLRRLGDERFDVLVVGGGITGAGVALDAASRGLRTALVERDDFASGTSSKSSKLVHGGLRYLQQREFRLVYEALYERQRALENAPHLVRVLPFLVPVLTRGGVIDRRLARVLGTALWVYDLTGGLRIGKRHHRIDVDTALAHMPTLARDRLAGAYVYYDAQVDDARLTLTIARTAAAARRGRSPTTLRCAGLMKDGDRVVGARVDADGRRDRGAGPRRGERGRACGPTTCARSTKARTRRRSGRPRASTSPCRGRRCATTSPPSSRSRATSASVFVVPWGDTTYVGTTDTDYDGPLDDPPCTPADVDYLLGRHQRHHRGEAHRADVVGTLGRAAPAPARPGRSTRTADLSRQHSVRIAPSGVVTVTGGKLTTYRRMAADAVDAAVDGARRATPRRRAPSTSGCSAARASRRRSPRSSRARTSTSPAATAPRPRSCSRSPPTIPTSPSRSCPACPTSAPRRRYAVRHEMARTLDDVLSRRTRARLLARDASADAAASWPRCSRPSSDGPMPSATREVDGVPRRDRRRTRRHLVSPLV